MTSAAALTVSFFEEFPNTTTVNKLELIEFDTRIYVAAKSLAEFQIYENEYKSSNAQVTEVIYWPVLEKEEGYWFSPWSERESLERIFSEIKNRENTNKLEVLLDLEPSLNRARLFNFQDFKHNKIKIEEFISKAEEYNMSILTVEKSYIPDWLLERLGLSFSPEKYGNRKIKMYYSSYRRKFRPNFIVENLLEKKVKKYAEQGISLGLGLIAPGIHEEKHRVSPRELEQEIKIASSYGIEEVIIFRLEGLTEEYRDSIKNAEEDTT